MYRPTLYTEVNSVQRRDAEDFSEEYSEEIGSMSGCCIDIGSGTGDVMVDFILPKLNPNSTVTCSDISEAMLNYAKKSYGDNKRLSFIKLDIETPDLPKDLVGRFDHVTSLYCIHWCLDLRKAFDNIYSLLRPGGSAFITFLASQQSLDGFTVLQAMPKYQSYMKEAYRVMPPFQYVERPHKTVMSFLTDAGFQVSSCSCRAMSYVFDTLHHFEEFLLALSPRETQRMSADLHGEFVKDLMKECLKHEIVFMNDRHGGNEYSVLMRYRAFVIRVKKPLAN